MKAPSLDRCSPSLICKLSDRVGQSSHALRDAGSTTTRSKVRYMAQRRRRASQSRSAASKPGDPPRRRRAQWRATVDSFGGFTVIGGITLAIVIIGLIVVRNPIGFSVSGAALLGDAVTSGDATHTTDALLTGGDPVPPVGGPHSPIPQRVGRYDEPISEENAVHALEHGIVWITYQPDALTPEQLDVLERVRSDFSRDVILSPRHTNADVVAVVSWEQRQTFDTVDEVALAEFITTNRNRSPEPGIR